jgi:hypothetical protein
MAGLLLDRRRDLNRRAGLVVAIRMPTPHATAVEPGLDDPDDDDRRAAVERYLDMSVDLVSRHELYHDDAVLEFPHSGERFEGVASFRAWREQYPEDVEFRIIRVIGSGSLWVAEVEVIYEHGDPILGVSVLEFDGLKVRRERIYGGPRWDAPEWRAKWRAATPAP